jgi:hypothetical protein
MQTGTLGLAQWGQYPLETKVRKPEISRFAICPYIA